MFFLGGGLTNYKAEKLFTLREFSFICTRHVALLHFFDIVVEGMRFVHELPCGFLQTLKGTRHKIITGLRARFIRARLDQIDFV